MFFNINPYFWAWILINLDARSIFISMTTEKWHEKIDFIKNNTYFQYLTFWAWHWPTLTHIDSHWLVQKPFPFELLFSLAQPQPGGATNRKRLTCCAHAVAQSGGAHRIDIFSLESSGAQSAPPNPPRSGSFWSLMGPLALGPFILIYQV